MSRRYNIDKFLTENNDKEISDTIIKHLGGLGKLDAMLGIKHVLYGRKSSNIHIKAKNSKKINLIVVRLQPNDEYTIEFYKGRGVNSKEVETLKDIPASSLKSSVERVTGLKLSLR
tara:strand:+ start:517 stop:864 length:348 start_codon:yes stop_codon:yes gene_type:complete